jgi:hypothetical protein
MARPVRVVSAARAVFLSLALGSALARAGADAPAAEEPAGGTKEGAVIVPAANVADDGGAVRPANVSYGSGARLRWVTVPAWMLNLFTKKNVPLSSWGTGISVFRRKGNFDLVGSFNYQNMSPSDGNWLGKNQNAVVDTDLVQFRGLALYSVDISFIWHQMFTDWIGIHYGAGVGVGIVAGEILRTSDDSSLCTADNASDLSQCHPAHVACTGSTCSEPQLQGLGPGMDSPTTPHRFSDPNVPPIVPIVNVVIGVDFRLPRVRGWEATIEGGFYDAFFLGGAVGYTF